MSLFKNIIATWLLTIMIAVPAMAFAQANPGPGPGGANPGPKPAEGIKNPLTCAGCDDLSTLITTIVIEVTKIGFYVVVFFIIYSGFLFVSAGGSTDKLKTAKTTFLYTVIGAAILLGANLLANVIKGTVDQLTINRHGPTQVL